MKTYTIKPLEWRQSMNKHFANDKTIIYKVEHGGKYGEDNTEYVMQYKDSDLWLDGFKNLEAAKAKAQELHESELAKYLQEVE